MRTHLRAKGLVWTRGGGGGGGGDVLKIFFSISYMYNTKSDYFSPKIKPYIYGNRKIKCKIIKYRPKASLYLKMETFNRL